MGLLLSHKRKLRIWNDMFSVSCIQEYEHKGGGKRGEVTVFSAASRYRLFRLLHQLEFKCVGFLTLTYPAEFPTNPKVYKAHLKEWRRRFENTYGKRQAVWRLEFQKRGAPHYHIMYLDWEFIEISELCYLWKSVVHTFDMAHEQNGVDLKLVTDSRQEALIASYLSKYIAKVDERNLKDDTKHAGRYWGCWNIVEPKPLELEITDWQAERIVTFALASRVGNQRWNPLDPTICSVFGSSLGSSEFNQLVRGYATYIGGGDI